MVQDPAPDEPVGDHRDPLARTTAVRAGQDVDGEDATFELGPTDRRVLAELESAAGESIEADTGREHAALRCGVPSCDSAGACGPSTMRSRHVATGPLVAIRSVTRYGSPPDELAFLAVSLGNEIAYTLVLGAAFHWRTRPVEHKRLFMLGMVVLPSAPFGRLTALPLLLDHVVGPGSVVVALAVWDRRVLGSLHPTTKVLGPAILLWELAPNLYMHSAWWMSFARWVTGVSA